MPSVSPIKKSPVTKYLLENKFRVVRQDNNLLWKHRDLYFYDIVISVGRNKTV